MACAGVAADSSNFSEYIQKNMKLYELENDLTLYCHSAASYVRGEVIIDMYDIMCMFMK